MKKQTGNSYEQLERAYRSLARGKKSWAEGAAAVRRRMPNGDVAYSFLESGLVPPFSKAAIQRIQGSGVTQRVRKVKGPLGAEPVLSVTLASHLVDQSSKGVPGTAAQAVSPPAVDLAEESSLKRRLLSTQAANASLKKKLAEHEDVDAFKRELLNLVQARATPKSKPKASTRKQGPIIERGLLGIPGLMLSDIHYGEVVSAARVNGLNSFDSEIAKRRVTRVVNTVLETLFLRQSGARYDGMVLCLAGDIINGLIIEELRRHSDKTTQEQVLEAAELLTMCVLLLASQFEWLVVKCVPGNHGRMDPRGGYKAIAGESFDSLVYALIEAKVNSKLGDKSNVDFVISTSGDIKFGIYNTNYLLTHGDTLNIEQKSFWSGLVSAATQRQVRELTARRTAIHHVLTGHFHRFGVVGPVLANGSIKGYDELAYSRALTFEPPQQMLWTTHPSLGIIDTRPIFGDEPAAAGPFLGPPVRIIGD